MEDYFDSYLSDDFHFDLRKTDSKRREKIWEVVRALGIEKAVNLAGDRTYLRVIKGVENALCYIEKKNLKRGEIELFALVLGFIEMILADEPKSRKKGLKKIRLALQAKPPPCCGADAEEWIRRSDLSDIAHLSYTTNACLVGEIDEKVLALQREIEKLGLCDANKEVIASDGVFGPQTYNFCEILRRKNADL